MDLTLHLTEACNLRCQYCYHPKSLKTMTEETLRSALALSGPSDRAAVSFFGGEPLLARSLILEAFAECDRIRRDTGRHFTFQMTTNGTLLDEEFLQIARERGMIIAPSYDGLAQDRNRRAAGGEGTAALVESKIPLLLQYLPYAPVMMTVSPACADLLADSVRRFVEADGFRYVLFNPAFGPGISWTERDLAVLAEQYQHLGELYITWHRQGRKVWLGPFESKIDAHIHGVSACARSCALGAHRLSVAADGRLYPCVQFVGDPAYQMGDVRSGIDEAARVRIQAAQQTQAACGACALRERCRHSCGCLNKLTSGDPRVTGGEACAHERLLIAQADRVAETLYRGKNRLFLRRHYDENYPLVSLLEDLMP